MKREEFQTSWIADERDLHARLTSEAGPSPVRFSVPRLQGPGSP